MPSLLSASTPAFMPSSRSSTSATKQLIVIVCRENQEIGTYEGGVLRPGKEVTSLIAWDGHTPFTKVVPPATNASVHSSPRNENTTVQSPIELIHPAGNEPHQTSFSGSGALEFHGDRDRAFNVLQAAAPMDHNYQPSALQFRDFQYQHLYNHRLGYPAYAPFQYHSYQTQLSCDVAISEANRPVWNPDYHKAISPSIERANQVVEEFKIYFGDGKSQELLLPRLQKMCILCGLCKASDLPNTSEECITVRSFSPYLTQLFHLLTPLCANRFYAKSTSTYLTLSRQGVLTSKAEARMSKSRPFDHQRNSSTTAKKQGRSAQSGSERQTHCFGTS